MPTRHIKLTPEQESAAKLEALRKQLNDGVEALERGEFTEVADADLDSYLASLKAAPRKRAR